MVANTYKSVFDAFTRNFIRRKARRLVGQLGLTKADIPDIEQELAFDLFQRLPSYDAQKAPRQAFIVRVVNNMVVTIARRQRAEQRDHRREACSLSEPAIDADGRDVTQAQLIGEDEGDFRLCMQTPSWCDRTELRMDLAQVLGNLPEKLRAICEQLMVHNPTQVARNLGIPRTTLYSLLPCIRSIFTNSGLRDYILGEPRHFSAASRM